MLWLLVMLLVCSSPLIALIIRDVIEEVREERMRQKERRHFKKLPLSCVLAGRKLEKMHQELRSDPDYLADMARGAEADWDEDEPSCTLTDPCHKYDTCGKCAFDIGHDPFESMDDEEFVVHNLVRDDWEPSYIMADFPWEEAYEDMLQEDVWDWKGLRQGWVCFFWPHHDWYIDMMQVHDEIMVGLELVEIAREAELEFLKIDLKKRQFGKVPKARRSKKDPLWVDIKVSAFGRERWGTAKAAPIKGNTVSVATSERSPIEKARRKARRSRNRSEVKQALKRYVA